ncbi:hypothetical protein DD829_16235 [Chryseobacterium sp. HMWF035]|nr:hypothetical protein DD829_16235 [Chryseobacterium sp. HMWF035]
MLLILYFYQKKEAIMKKVLFGAILFPLILSAQVGVNTALPAATLDVTAKNKTGTTNNVDGFLFPRVDRQRAQSMTGVKTSTLIYVDSIATGTQTGTTVNMDKVGFYYFDGTVWSKLNTLTEGGTAGQVLTSNGAGAAPSWITLNTVSGTIASANYVQGTTALTINQGTTADVPGVTIVLTVPTGKTQTFLFTILGFAINATGAGGVATQGVFSLLQNGTKISSAYTSSGDGGSLINLPAPTTFLKSVTLSAGTYIFKVQYSAWSGDQIVNANPSNYVGYNGDTEAMLTKMQVLVYNN